ncbi:hypothetical protein BGZ95_010043 [Linnemannia exigua]|uniref:Uncharacterized protein n=1 Tax=Linnemannia exigua TaxID=604196 RepID=A0AAD4H7F1_9FUNG|nr:hypothetical protein BGZ95_010043 [Linnemannia exigua]
MSTRILSDDDWVDGAASDRKTHIKPSSASLPPPSISSTRLSRAPQKMYGNLGGGNNSNSNYNNSNSNNNNNNNNNSSSTSSSGSFSYNYVKSTYNLGNSNSNSNSSNNNNNNMNGVGRTHPASRDPRHGTYGFFSSGQNMHHFESYLSRKGHQDIQTSHQAKPAPERERERVSVPLPEGTGKAEGVWNAFNGSYTPQDWANFSRNQVAPGAKRPVTTPAATATARMNAPTNTLVASRQAQALKPSLSTSITPAHTPASAIASASAPASAPFRAPSSSCSSSSTSSSSSSSPSTSKPSVAQMAQPLQSPTPLIDLEFVSSTPVTPVVDSSVFADLLDLDFTDCVSTASPVAAAAADSATIITVTPDTTTTKNSAEKPAETAEESTLIDFSDTCAATVPDGVTSLSTSSVTFGEASQSDDHLAADGYTTSTSDYDNTGNDSDSDSSDDDDHHHHQFEVDKSLENDKDPGSDVKGIFVDFATLASLRTELLDANVTWEDLLTRLKGVRG